MSAMAVLPIHVVTDSGGNIIGGSYSGSGTVQPDATPGTFSTDGVVAKTLVAGSTGGAFTINPGALANTPGTDPRFETNENLGATITYSILGGGSADFTLTNSTTNDGSDTLFNSFGLTNFSGNVTGVSVTVAYNQYVGGRDRTETVNRPMLAALGMVNAGTGSAGGNYTVGMNFNDVYSSIDGTNFLAGLAANPSGAPLVSNGVTVASAGSTSFGAPDGFTGTIGVGSGNPHFILLRGYDMDGSGLYTPGTDDRRVYAKEVEFTIGVDGASTAFVSDTQFTFSMDGANYSNVVNVPEPSALLLGSLGVLALLRRSRRSH